MKYSDIIRVLSPIVFFIFHITYLIVWSPDPFLKKWIDGSFTFFIALVLCNIIRARIVAHDARSGQLDAPSDEGDGSERNGTP